MGVDTGGIEVEMLYCIIGGVTEPTTIAKV